jgi:hypothetical protein
MIFSDFKSNSKVWMYISSEILDDSTQNTISEQFSSFVKSWKSHGDQVDGKLLFMDNHVVIVAADVLGNSMCGRAVDSQVRFIQDLETLTGFTLMNRQNICLKNKDDSSYVVPFSSLKKLLENRDIDANTMVYNSMIQLNNESVILPLSHSPFGGMILS